MILNLVKPHVYQAPVVTTVKKALETRDEVLFVLATGLGKTIVSALIVEEWLLEGKRGLFLCHENDILAQAEQEYKKVVNNIVYKTFYGQEEKDWTADNGNMLFASFQALNNWHEKWYLAFDKDHFDFMIVDESHHGQAPTYKEVIDYFVCKKIGMTATPDRMDLKDIREIFGEEVYTITLEEGIANGWLTNVEYHIVSDGINNRKLKKICRDVLKKGKRVSIKQINETIFIKERDLAEKRIIDEYTQIKDYARGKKTMIFCENIEHSETVTQYFENAGVVHSKRRNSHNTKVLKDFREGALQYVSSVDKFNEGIDVPDVEVVVFLRATDSLTVFFQQLGRALRKTALKTKVIVLDFVANVERLIMVRDLMNRIREVKELNENIKLPVDKNPFNVTGEGFEFIFSDELVDIMKVIEALREGYYSTWQEASKAALSLGVKDSPDYSKKYKRDPRLPSNPYSVYPNFPGWPIFLKFKMSKEGWITNRRIALEIGLNKNTVKDFVEQFRQEHPDWFEFCHPGRGQHAEYYHPLLVELIKSKFKKIEKISGWISLTDLIILLGKGRSATQRVIDELRVNNASKISILSSKGLTLPSEQYHPDFVEKVREQFRKEEIAPQGWKTATSLRKDKRIIASFETIVAFANGFRAVHSEWFKNYYLPTSIKFTEFYHPDLVGKIKKEYGKDKRKKAPKGWMSPSQLEKRRLIKSKARTIKKYAEQFRNENPAWFNVFWIKSAFLEHYHPKLIEKIKEEFDKRKIALKGWITSEQLEQMGIKKAHKIKIFVQQFRKSNSDWFETFLTKKGNWYTEHYHPDLVQKIKTHFAKKGE